MIILDGSMQQGPPQTISLGHLRRLVGIDHATLVGALAKGNADVLLRLDGAQVAWDPLLSQEEVDGVAVRAVIRSTGEFGPHTGLVSLRFEETDDLQALADTRRVRLWRVAPSWPPKRGVGLGYLIGEEIPGASIRWRQIRRFLDVEELLVLHSWALAIAHEKGWATAALERQLLSRQARDPGDEQHGRLGRTSKKQGELTRMRMLGLFVLRTAEVTTHQQGPDGVPNIKSIAELLEKTRARHDLQDIKGLSQTSVRRHLSAALKSLQSTNLPTPSSSGTES